MGAKNNQTSEDKKQIVHGAQTTRPTSDRVVQIVIMSQLVMDRKLWRRMSRCRTMYRKEVIATCRLLSEGFGDCELIFPCLDKRVVVQNNLSCFIK